ncbi:M23 family metallopeptidase [Sporosarcina highlanderae]|uniref:M23 family metallopeptidase n=1 Tax=Sporosarcina highlanderae TaxID=3035916 RepID=A0ABT8JNL5_9BACL|nr:M23 family metallopeptidase [Sporosarcina highlanderae]MDN4605987.1 M23 family metallopeptidase [Sporosarcina highlanderae]
MREEKPKSPSQKNKSQKNRWFWPAIYAGIAIVFVGMIWGYNAIQKGTNETADATADPDSQPIVETNAANEVLKYPFSEELFDNVAIIQDYYDVEASEEDRENALLVFNQVYITNKGVTISVDGQPFEVVAAMSGTVQEVILDQFKGGEIKIAHANGMTTVYSSLTGILVKQGDEVIQGQSLGTATANEWNVQAGTHLLFEVHKDGIPVNPRSYLGF